jgi:phosphoribosylanthranilate isomerase
MSIWIKICANTSLMDARLAVEAGADAVGFVFAPSPRRVTVEEVAAIAPHLGDSVEKIGVFVDADGEFISAAIERAGLTGVQLHSGSGEHLAAELRQRFGRELRILQVVHFGADAAELEAALGHSNLDGILVDSRTSYAIGGTGIAFDWEAASRGVFKDRGDKKMIAAGGLNPENVAKAIQTLRPWGVDVASGVELKPGKKDAGKVVAFVANARAAARDLR